MKKFGFAFALVLVFASSANALTISQAEINAGQLLVSGAKVAPDAQITIDGTFAGSATRRGTFSVQLPLHPADCVVDVSDGFDTVPAVVKNCGQQGPGGVSGYTIVQNTISDTWSGMMKVFCPVGMVPVGGGGYLRGLNNPPKIINDSHPIDQNEDDRPGWQISFICYPGTCPAEGDWGADVTIYAICVNAG